MCRQVQRPQIRARLRRHHHVRLSIRRAVGSWGGGILPDGVLRCVDPSHCSPGRHPMSGVGPGHSHLLRALGEFLKPFSWSACVRRIYCLKVQQRMDTWWH